MKLSKIFIDKDGEPSANPTMEFPEKPDYEYCSAYSAHYCYRNKANANNFCKCDHDYDKAVEQWHEGALKFASKASITVILTQFRSAWTDSGELKPNTFISVDLEVEVVHKCTNEEAIREDRFCDTCACLRLLRIVDKKQ